MIECDRVLIRAAMTGAMSEAATAERRGVLARAAAHWVVFDLDSGIVDRARRPFPVEPIRTLDAIHVATAVMARSLVPDLAILSLDDRLRRSAREMGLSVLPGQG